MSFSRVPELLAPAGSPACLPAAVAGGADAVYLGLSRFSARARAENFEIESLPHHVDYLHGHGRRCFVTLNTLLYDRELPAAVAAAEQVAAAGADAVILQDLGLWRILRRELPGLELHASTQMTVHAPEQVEVLAELGARRIILARELSFAELSLCVATARRHGVEVECFVHGALCYAYSGQCTMSAMATGRSANRGACEQCCRFDYDDGSRRGPLLSMADLKLLDLVPQLADAGVACLKIEGRLKSPEYVYTVSMAYRAALDAWSQGAPFDGSEWHDRLREVFSRPFTSGPLSGELGEGGRVMGPERKHETPDARLVRVSRRHGNAILHSLSKIHAGQGFSYFLEDGSTGGLLVTRARPEGASTWHCEVRIAARGPHLPEGLALFRNTDQQRAAEARRAMACVPLSPPPPPTIALDLSITARTGDPVELAGDTADGRSARVIGPPVDRAHRHPLDEETIRTTVGALGGTGFRPHRWHLALAGDAFVPSSVLKALRRQLVEELAALPIPEPRRWQLPEPHERRHDPLVVAVAGDMATARQLLAAGADQVWLDDPRLDLWQASSPPLPPPEPGLWLRLPAAAAVPHHLLILKWPVVAGHLGALRAARAAGLPAIADAGLNVANHATANALAKLGVCMAFVSPELDPKHIRELVTRTELPCLALTAGQPLLMSSRQRHDLDAGLHRQLRTMRTGTCYQLERHVAGLSMIRDSRPVDRLNAVVDLVPELAGVVLETGTMSLEQALALAQKTRREINRAPAQ